MTISEKDIYSRASLLLGDDVMEKLSNTRVIIFGVGGVGSWCAEGLLRSGITHLTIVDCDVVCPSNLNRQLMATTRTIGRPKVEVLQERLLEINPFAHITTLKEVYCEENSQLFDLGQYDYIIDAIDSLKDKVSLIMNATATDATFFSSMGAALKTDPTKIRVAEFWEVRGCPLGAVLRKKMRKSSLTPGKKFLCVYDEEVLPNRGEDTVTTESDEKEDSGIGKKAVINGTTAHITAIFGFTLSGLVIHDVYRKVLEKESQITTTDS